MLKKKKTSVRWDLANYFDVDVENPADLGVAKSARRVGMSGGVK